MQDIDVLGFANDRARDLGALQSMLAAKHAPLDCLRHPKKKQKIEAEKKAKLVEENRLAELKKQEEIEQETKRLEEAKIAELKKIA